MSGKPSARALFLAIALALSAAARADLGAAQKAYAAKDLATAFELYREIAELGNVAAQENIAAMYVDGEGVRRNNTIGFAWALIARENGGSAAMQNIIDQLQPHLDAAARARVQEITDLYGKAALQNRLLPAPYRAPPKLPVDAMCAITRPADPGEFYPPEASSAQISGSVFIEARISTDGHAHRSIAWYSVPEGTFGSAGRDLASSTGYSPKKIQGAPQPCSVRYRVKFRVKSPADDRVTEAYQKTRVLAAAGDPVAQLYYGLLMFDREERMSATVRPLDWYLKAAQAGIPYAQYLVGVELVDLDRAGPDEENAREIAKGLTWLKLSAANGRAEARFALANYQLATHPEAVSDPAVFAWLEDAAAAKHRDATLYLGALLAASPDSSRRDPARAIELIDLKKWDFSADPTALEILAAANAQLNRFEDARTLQKRAIQNASKRKWDVAPLQARLAKYQRGAPWTGNLLEP